MKFIILGKNIEVTDALKNAVESKIGKLEKYFTPETEVHVTLSVEKERQSREASSAPSRFPMICMYPSIWWRRSLRDSSRNTREN